MNATKQRRRPTLEELKKMPREMWELELAYVAEAAKEMGLQDVEQMASDLFKDGSMSPSDVVGLREQLQPVAKEVQV